MAVPVTTIADEKDDRIKECETLLKKAQEYIQADHARMRESEALLKRAQKIIQADKEELAQLYIEYQIIISENTMLKLENDDLIREIKRRKGLYAGANISMPLGGNVMLMYKFSKFGIYAIGGYNQHSNIGIGLLYKLP